jgi:hypothetical protein
MPVGHEEEAFIFMLEFDPVLQHTMVMPKMQMPGWAHT